MMLTIAALGLRTYSASCSGSSTLLPRRAAMPRLSMLLSERRSWYQDPYLDMATNRGANMRLPMQAESDKPRPGHVFIPKSLDQT